MDKTVKETIHAQGIEIGIYTTDFENEFISLTDIAKYRNEDDPRFVIQNWMRNRNTIEFLGVWEILHNPSFNRVQFDTVKNEAGANRFVMTPTKWIEQTNAIGIVSKAGRYGGGTFAHTDIAMSFATWLISKIDDFVVKKSITSLGIALSALPPFALPILTPSSLERSSAASFIAFARFL